MQAVATQKNNCNLILPCRLYSFAVMTLFTKANATRPPGPSNGPKP